MSVDPGWGTESPGDQILQKSPGVGEEVGFCRSPSQPEGESRNKFGLEGGVWVRSWGKEKVKRGAAKLRR